MQKFIYRNVIRVSGWGCSFDSLLELKSALSVREDFCILRSPVPIWFNPSTLAPVDELRGNTRRYTPDFLIRHKQTNEAFLIELKPRKFSNGQQLLTRKKVAENYIRNKGFDWIYKIVYDDEFSLTAAQQTELEAIIQQRKKPVRHLPQRYQAVTGSLWYNEAPCSELIRFVLFG